MKTDPNEPITPYKMPVGFREMRIWPGLTKREYFAAMAMLGLLACPQVGMANIPTAAVRNADALIKALNEPTETEPKKDL